MIAMLLSSDRSIAPFAEGANVKEEKEKKGREVKHEVCVTVEEAVDSLGNRLDAALVEAACRRSEGSEVKVDPDAVKVSSGSPKEGLFSGPTCSTGAPSSGWTSGPDLPHWIRVRISTVF